MVKISIEQTIVYIMILSKFHLILPNIVNSAANKKRVQLRRDCTHEQTHFDTSTAEAACRFVMI